jgi:NAD(P)-dependent dehydrogenase (short-subunit alcohol dehydrogenase family)
MGKLEGKTALITGGNSGIGWATAKLFAHEGADVFITGRRQEALNAVVAEIGSRAIGVQGDVSNLNDLDRLVAAIKAKGVSLDIVFANAGGGTLVPIAEVSRLSAKWIGTVLDRCAENVNCIAEVRTEPDAQDVEKLNRLTAESWRKRGLQGFGSFPETPFPVAQLHGWTYQPRRKP